MVAAPGATARLFEAATFVAFALAVHVAVAATLLRGHAYGPGAGDGGGGGDGPIALQGGGAATARLIEAWETLPRHADAPVPARLPEASRAPAIDDLPPARDALASADPEAMAEPPEAAPPPVPPRLDPARVTRSDAPELAVPTVTDAALAAIAPVRRTQRVTEPETLRSVAPMPDPPVPPRPEAAPDAAAEAPLPPKRPQRLERPASRLAARPRQAARQSAPSAPAAAVASAPGAGGDSEGVTEGAGQQAGTAGTGSDPSASPGGGRALLRVFGNEVLAAVAGKRHYPRAARESGQEGVVRLNIVIDRAGRLVAAQVDRSSGHEVLDAAAVAAARAVSRFPRAPAALPGVQFSFTIPMRFAMR